MRFKNRQRKISRGVMPIQEILDQYGDMPMCDFVDLAITHGLIPLNMHLSPYDELAIYPQHRSTPALSVQNGPAS
jgi:hypothetical protein